MPVYLEAKLVWECDDCGATYVKFLGNDQAPRKLFEIIEPRSFAQKLPNGFLPKGTKIYGPCCANKHMHP